jgi:hypothetical protein
VVLANANLVLVAAFGSIGKLFGEDNVVRGRFVLDVHLKYGPPAEGGGDIDGRLNPRLGEGDGRATCHGGVGGYVAR